MMEMIITSFLYFIISFILFFISWHIWLKMTIGFFNSNESMKNKTVLITGGNSGLGLETVKDLLKRGAKIILASRQVEKSKKIKENLIKEIGNTDITIYQLDLSSQSSVRSFADEIKKSEDVIDVLIHNSGCASTSKTKISADGIELTMATNHYGPFLLTHLLIDLLRASSSPRIVIVSSAYYKIAPFNVEKHLNPLKTFPMYNYYLSKTANIMFGLELSKRLKTSGISVYLVNPGMCNTDIFKKVPFPLNLIVKNSFKSSNEGSQTINMCAVSKFIQNSTGDYYSDCEKEELWSFVKNDEKNKLFWEKSYEIVKLMANKDPKI